MNFAFILLVGRNRVNLHFVDQSHRLVEAIGACSNGSRASLTAEQKHESDNQQPPTANISPEHLAKHGGHPGPGQLHDVPG
jgi:hypothetical protein